MLTFIFDCADLFGSIFTAMYGLDILQFLILLIFLETGFGLYFVFYRGMKKT